MQPIKKLSSTTKINHHKKNVSLETVKLNSRQMCKVLQVKQSAKFSPSKKVINGVF